MEAVLPLTMEQYSDLRSRNQFGPFRHVHPACGIGFKWVDLAQRLHWTHGMDGALKRLNAPAEPPAPELIAA